MSIQRCRPEAPVYDRDLTDEALLLKALGDPARATILATLARTDHEVCVRDFASGLGLNQSTISHHLKLLGRATAKRASHSTARCCWLNRQSTTPITRSF